MKTSSRIRTIALSLFALAALGMASKTFAAVDAFIWFEDTHGKVSKVSVQSDGLTGTISLKDSNGNAVTVGQWLK